MILKINDYRFTHICCHQCLCFWEAIFIYQTENVTFPLLGHVHVTTVTLFELGILLTVVGVIVTVMLSISGVDHEFNITPCDRFLVFIGTYMILSINLIRIVIGISIYTHGNLIIMSMGKYGPHMSEPLIQGHAQNFVDPLLQAIVLTAIVIDLV